MLGYELIKTIKSKFLIASVAIMFVLFGVFVYFFCFEGEKEKYSNAKYYYELVDDDKNLNEEAAAYYDELSREIMSENGGIAVLQTQKGRYDETAYGDYYLLSVIQSQSEYAKSGYADDMVKIVEKSYKSMSDENSTYGKRYYNKIIDVYNTVTDIDVIPQDNVVAFLEIFHGETSVILGMIMVLWIIMLTAYVMGMEETNAIGTIIKSTAAGRRKLTMVKLGTLAILTLIMTVVITVAEFIIGIVGFNINSNILRASIQSLSAYELADIKISVAGMVLLAGAARFVFLLVVMAFTAMVTAFLKSISASAISTVIFEGQLIMLMRMNKTGYLADMNFMKIRQYNPVGLIWFSSYMKSYDYGAFLNIPVKILYECMAISMVCIIIFGVIAAIKPEYVNRSKRYGIKGN